MNMRALTVAVLLLPSAAITVALGSRAQAQAPGLDVSQYSHTAWTTRDGFLRSGVRSIAQTPDGYLWLATEFGLVRFDGVRFVDWAPPAGQHLPSTNIRSLVAGRDGTLWIGTLEGLASWKDGKLQGYSDLAKHNVLALVEDKDGNVWAGTFGVPKGQLCAIREGVAQCFGADGRFGQWVWSLYLDSDGRLWAGAETGLWRWKPGPPKRFPMPHPIETSQSIAQADPHSGPLAIGQGIWQLRNDKIQGFDLGAQQRCIFTPVNMFLDHNGDLWVGTLQHGVFYRSQGRTTRFAQTEGLSGDRVLTFFEDREGNFWVGTFDGLDRFHRPTAVSVSAKQGLSSPTIWTVLGARDQSVWMSTLDGLNRWSDGDVTVYRSANSEIARQRATQKPQASSCAALVSRVTEKTDPGLPDDRAGSLYEDDLGRIWVSSPAGVARFENGRFTHVKEVPAGWVNVITGDSNGGVWISYQDHGLVHWVGGKVVETVPWSTLGGDVIASSLIPDPKRGGLWVGFFQGGLMYFKDRQIGAHYSHSDGLGEGRVMGLQLEGDGTIWAATEGGLSRLKEGHIATLTTANGLPCNTVHWTMELDSSFWLYTACGLLRIPRAELEKWSADPNRTIQVTSFDSSDGVRSHALLSGYSPRVGKSPDGRLWFAHFDSVSVVDPHDLRVNQLPPPVHIEQVTADGKTYAATEGLLLPSRIRDLAIDYTALSLVAPEKVHFRFKLDGQDKEWREVVNNREVQYSNLAPGKYRFRVTANNNSGVWNEAGTALDFSISPAYYQTSWFAALCAVLMMALLWAAYQWRLRDLHRQFEMTLEARVSERTRIARDLHDTLLQSFHGLLLRFQTASQLLPERPREAKEKLDSAIDQAADAITEGRDAVQGLRDSAIQSDLALAIRTLGEELATNPENHRPVFGVAIEGQTRNLDPLVQDEIYKIATEALRNAFQHAQASRVEVEIRYDDKQFRLRIRDDGKGIDATVLSRGSDGHYGLRGMRERATLMGGQFTVWSEVDAGTEVELRVPAGSAYGSVRRSTWFSTKSTGKAKA